MDHTYKAFQDELWQILKTAQVVHNISAEQILPFADDAVSMAYRFGSASRRKNLEEELKDTPVKKPRQKIKEMLSHYY